MTLHPPSTTGSLRSHRKRPPTISAWIGPQWGDALLRGNAPGTVAVYTAEPRSTAEDRLRLLTSLAATRYPVEEPAQGPH